jgi:hypothetical protein
MLEVHGSPSLITVRGRRDTENKMEEHDAEQLTALLQATLVAVSALIATHPKPSLLREAFETFAKEAPHPHPNYEETLAALRKSIP